MTTKTALCDIPGGQELIDWFGYVPGFHDAYLLDANFMSNGQSSLRIHAFRMTDEVDDKGYFVLDRHVVVTITLEAVTHINLSDFNLPGIIFELTVSSADGDIQLTWTGSYGIEGTIRAKQARFSLQPGKPA
ncbi:MAG: hypothetical protein ACLPX9_04440 [Rhodomicrobium sp.]